MNGDLRKKMDITNGDLRKIMYKIFLNVVHYIVVSTNIRYAKYI